MKSSNILSQSGWWMVNKSVAHYFKCKDTAVLLAFLITKQQYYLNNRATVEINGLQYFYATSESIDDELLMPYRCQKRCIENLVKSGCISVKKIGVPAKLHFHVDDEAVLEIVLNSEHNTLQNVKTQNLQNVKTAIYDSPKLYINKDKEIEIKRTNLLETPSGSLKSSSNFPQQTSEPLTKKKFKEFDTYENIFLSQEKIEQYILDKFQEYEDYAIGDILSLITQAVNDYDKKNRHITHKNTEAFVDRWISRNIYSSNTVIHPNESQSYKHLSTRELVQMVELNAEMIYKILTPPEPMFVPIAQPKRKVRNLLADDLDD